MHCSYTGGAMIVTLTEEEKHMYTSFVTYASPQCCKRSNARLVLKLYICTSRHASETEIWPSTVPIRLRNARVREGAGEGGKERSEKGIGHSSGHKGVSYFLLLSQAGQHKQVYTHREAYKRRDSSSARSRRRGLAAWLMQMQAWLIPRQADTRAA